MVRLEDRVSALALKPPSSLKFVLAQLSECPQAELLTHLRDFKGQYWERCTAIHWHPLLNRFDDILAAYADVQKRGAPDAPSSELVCEVLRALYDILLQHAELKGAFASGDRLRDLLDCTDLHVVLGTLRCFSVCPPGRHLRGTHGVVAERRLEALAGGASWPGGLCAACSRDCPARDFAYEVPRVSGEALGLTALTVPAARIGTDVEELFRELVAAHGVPEAYHAALRLQLSMWCHARTTEGRREVVAISLYALCNAVKHLGAGFLHQHLQKRPGLFAELCDLLQNLQAVGHEVGVAALRATGAVLDSRYGQNRSEMTQLSQMLGLSVPHGIVACALRNLLGEEPPSDQLENHYKVLMAALDLFQITTASNHQTTVQLGHAGMILAMLELMQKKDLQSLPAVVGMLRCLELAAEVSGSTALVLFRDFRGLSAFSTRLQQEVDLLMELNFQGDVYDTQPPAKDAPEADRRQYWHLLEEVTARRRLCRQLLKNIQVALQCSEVVQAGLANVFQGPLMDVLKKALKEPQKVGLCLFGTAIDIVSNLIQDDPSRVPQMIESGVLPGIVGALNKDTMRSVECLSFVPGVLGSVSLHAAGEEFILNAPSQPIRLLTDILVDPSFAALLHSQPELAQIMSTHVDKVLRNRPSGSTKLTELVVDCIIDAMKAILEQAKQYPPWSPTDPEDHTEFLADRLAAFGRFCWSVLGTNEQTLQAFLDRKGLALIQELHELPCLPHHLCSLEGQPHPLGSLFNLQAAGPKGNAAVLGALQDMLKGHHGRVAEFLQEYLHGPGDPYKVLAGASSRKVDTFLSALSGLTAVLEGLQAVCREGTSVQVLEALQEPVSKIGDVAPKIFALAAWRPKEKDVKNPQFGTYTELARSVFTEKAPEKPAAGKDAMDVDAGSAPMDVDGEASPQTKAMLHVARQCFSLAAHTMRQFLVITSKQLHSRTRQREVTPGVLSLGHKLAAVSKGILSVERPSQLSIALRWAGDAFDLLLKMHEEQNRVAIRPLCLCTFYQCHGFALLGPLLQFIAQNLEVEPGPAALCSGLTYLEKVTSHKRFTNAPQVNLLRAEDGLIPKDPLCRSVQGEALKCVLPVWRQGDFSKFPDTIGQSLMKVWVHTLDGPRDIPARPAPRNAEGGASAQAGDGAPAPPGAAETPDEGGGDRVAQAIISTLVDMGFGREQVERGMRQLGPAGHLDIGTLIMWMVSNPEPAAQDSPAPAAATPAPTAAASPPAPAEPGAPAADAPAAPAAAPAEASPAAGVGALGAEGRERDTSGRLRAMTPEEFQAEVSDMLKDLLPRILTFGRQVPKAMTVVADTMAFIVALSTPLWEAEPGKPRKAAGKENAEMVVKVCLAELGEGTLLPPADALACVTQVLASLLHRRPQVAAAMGEAGMSDLLTKLHRWSLMSIDYCVLPFARGYRTVCFGSAAPAPPGVGEALLSAPAWLTPVVVCAHQLLSLADLVKLRPSRKELDTGIQRNWVARVLHIIYAFPGMDAGLAMACLQVLMRLCSTSVGRKAFLEYQPRLLLDAAGSSLKAPAESAGGLLLMLRWARQASFPGMLQMLADFVLLLLEEGPTLQQRMETEILALFTPQARALSAKDISRQLFPLMSRSPELFEEALKAVTQRPHDAPATGDQLMLEPIPEGERPQRPKHRGSVDKSPVPLLVLQTLIWEACFGLEVQHRTAFNKIYEAALRKSEGEEGEEAPPPKPVGLPPPFPLAMGPDSILYLLDFVLTRVPGLSGLLLKQPAPPPAPAPAPQPGAEAAPGDFLWVEDPSYSPQKSLLLVMTRHLLPRFARLSELWLTQVEALRPAQRAALQQSGATNHVQRCLPHLTACLCSAARHASEPRRCLVVEAIVALRSLAEGPGPAADGPQRGSYAAQVAAVSGLVARLLSAAAAADRKDDKENAGDAGNTPAAAPGAQDEAQRPGSATSGAAEAATPKRAKGRKEAGFFSVPGETQVLRDSLVSILSHMDLYRSDSSAVATTVVKCLEILSRREAKKDAGQGQAQEGAQPALMAEDPIDAEDPRFGDEYQGAEYEVGEGDEHDDEEEDEEEEDDEDMADDGDAGLDGAEGLDAMDVRDGHHHEDDHGGEEEEDDYDDEMEDDEYGDDVGDEMAGDAAAQNNLAAILNNAIHVFDQQGLHPDNMTLRVDIDLGEAGVIHGVSRAGQFQQLRRGGARNGAVATGGWSEPGDLDVPTDHPLLRREHQQQHQQHQQQQAQHAHHHHQYHHHVAEQDGRLLQWIPAPGSIRQIFGPEQAGGRHASRSNPADAEGFDDAFNELSSRLRANVRVANPPPPAAAAADSAAAPVPSPPGGAAAAPRSDEAPATSPPPPAPAGADPAGAPSAAEAAAPEQVPPPAEAAAAQPPQQQEEAPPAPQQEEPAAVPQPTEPPAPAAEPAAEPMVVDEPPPAAEATAAPPPADAPAPEAADAAPPAAAAPDAAAASEAEGGAAAPVAAPAEAPAEAAPAAEVASSAPEAPVEAAAAAVDAAASLGIPELARLADRLGCTQLEILQAAEIDPTVVAELPEDMRSMVVMSTISQVNIDHLRRPSSAASGGRGGGASAEPDGGGVGEIDAAVLEALPPEIREEVLREERARLREQERAAQRAAAAAATPETSLGGGGAAPNTSDMDNASFIASLDPILREEVLMTAPEELLQSLPAELVAEAQLIRDRAFTRIASRREAPPQPQAPQQVVVRVPPPSPTLVQHSYLQAMEQQMLAAPAVSRRPWAPGAGPGAGGPGGAQGLLARHQPGGGLQMGEEVLAQLGLHHHFRVAVGGQSSRQLIAFGPAPGTGGATGAQGLSSFEAADRHLLERLGDYDEVPQGGDAPQPPVELPLPLVAIPGVCRLLYLRQEVAVTPLTRLFFNLSLHPQTRNSVLGHFLLLLCRRPEVGSRPDSLPPPHLFEGLEGGRAPQVNTTEIQAIGSQRILAVIAYLLRRIPQCGEFFAKQWPEEKWVEVLQAHTWPEEERRKKITGAESALSPEGAPATPLPGQYFINLMLQLLTTKLFLSSSQHATWLLSILHALLVQHRPPAARSAEAPAAATPAGAPAAPADASPAAPAAAGAENGTAPAGDAPAAAEPAAAAEKGSQTEPAKLTADQQVLERWSKITKDMHGILSQQSVLALCHFLCQAGSGHGATGEGDAFQMTADILVALAASQTHLDMVRSELMRVLATLVKDIEAALTKCEATTAEPSTMEARFLRVVRALAEVFKEAVKTRPDKDLKIEDFLEEASIEVLWNALDHTLERLGDTEVMATPAQRLLSMGLAPSAVRVEASSGLSAETKAQFASNVQAAPPKPLLNRLLPLIEAFFVLHDGTKEAEQERREKEEQKKNREEEERVALLTPLAGKHVFSELAEVSLVENSRLGAFCKRHRRPLNALVKQTPGLLAKSFSPLLKHMPMCLDFDNKRANFRSQLRSRRLESRFETIRLRVRRSEIFMDSYHQLRMRSGEEMRAKIQVQFQGEEGIDAGGVGKEWYTALAREIFNPNYALFVQAGGKACTYHPNPMSYVNRDHLHFFQFIGRVVGKAIHDGQNLEAWFTRGFYKHMLGKKVIPADLEAFDPEYFSNLKWMLDHDITGIVELNFCAESDELGQQKIVDLKPEGRRIPVTNENKFEYIQLMAEHKMTNSVRQQIDAFLKGLHEIVPPELLSLFDDKELELLISGLPDIDVEDLRANTEYHNYTPQSEQVQWFWKVLSEFTQEQRAWFLQFATGTTRVPVEGFKGLIGMRGPQKFSIHRAYGADRLPSAHTCFNQLDLPDYPSEEVLREKLLQAVREGHEGFGFA